MNPAPGAGTGTLRQAMIDSNANAGADIITFNPGVTGTILLSAALPNLAEDVTISGPGANVLTVLRPEGTCSDNGATCTGDTSPCANPATAICVATADFGIFSVDSGKTVTISGLTITGGIGTGGGIWNDNATLTVNDCTISGNSAGVGIFNFGKPGPATMTINNSTISGNSGDIGGGISNNGNTGGSATLTVTNSTISGNSAILGGGIYNSGGAGGSVTLTVTNSTISGNSADISGGGIFNDGGTLNLNSSIVANSAGGDGERGAGTVNAQYSLIEDSSIGFVNGTNTGNVSGQDPMLGPLKDNGGPTFTHELLTGSAAINAGDPNFTPPPDFDQRGTGFSTGGKQPDRYRRIRGANSYDPVMPDRFSNRSMQMDRASSMLDAALFR